MTRLIDADALKKAFKKSPFVNEVHLYYARQLINLAPTVEERPHGEKKCPNCGSDLYEYCFMCCYEGKKVGADYEGEKVEAKQRDF